MSRPFSNHRHRRSHRQSRSNAYIRRIGGFGKFQGETVDSVFAYDCAMYTSDICSHGDGGSSTTRVDGPFTSHELFTWRGDFHVERDRVCGTNDRLNRAERRFIKQQAGCMVHETDDGFVYVSWYDNQEALDMAWKCAEEYYYGDEESPENEE